MKIGEKRQEGVVVVECIEEEKFVVECGMCSFRSEYERQATADWITFSHNKSFQKRGCDA